MSHRGLQPAEDAIEGLEKLRAANARLIARFGRGIGEDALTAMIEDCGRTGLSALHDAINAGMSGPAWKASPRETAGVLAFPFMSYIRAVSRYCRDHQIDQIYFLSREGLFFKRLHEAMGCPGPTARYLCVSRTSLFMLTVEALDETSVDRMLDLFQHHSHLADVSIGQFLYVLKIENRAAARIVRSLGHDVHRVMPLKEHRAEIKAVLLDDRMRRLFARRRSRYLEAFMNYLRALNLTEHRRVLLCDMGWSGSMQTYLSGILKQQGCDVQLHGFYFGYDKTIDARKHARAAEPVVKTGYFTYDGDPSRLRERGIINNLSLELLASAGHGTVVGYRNRRGGAEPVFEHYPEEIWQYNRVIYPLQSMILDYAARYHEVFDALHGLYQDEEVYAYNADKMHALIHQPGPEFRRLVAFVFYDDFYGKSMRIPWAPYGGLEGRAGVYFEMRRIAGRLVHLLVPQGLLGRWVTGGATMEKEGRR